MRVAPWVMESLCITVPAEVRRPCWNCSELGREGSYEICCSLDIFKHVRPITSNKKTDSFNEDYVCAHVL